MRNRVGPHGAPPRVPDYGSIPVVGTRSVGATPNPPTGPNAPYVAPQQFQTLVSPWWDKQWDAAQAWFVKSLNFTVLAGQVAGPTTLIPNLSYTVPLGNRSVLKSFRMTVQNPVATINLSLTLFKGGAPIPGYTGFAFDPVSATGIILPVNESNITLTQGDIITAAFTEASVPASNWTCSLQISGWQLTEAEIDRVMGSLKY